MLKVELDKRVYKDDLTEKILDRCSGGVNIGDMERLVYELQFRSPKDHKLKEKKAQALLKLLDMYKGKADVDTKPKWPTTDTKKARKKMCKNLDVSWRDIGVLKASGYTVGEANGKLESERTRILNSLMLDDDLMDIQDRAYAREYGDPKSSVRLMKLAHSLASFIRNASRVSSRDNSKAINDWKVDLDYLKTQFYSQWPDFKWPE